MEEYGIRYATCDELPRGVIIGTVELYECDEGDWMLRKPDIKERPGRLPEPILAASDATLDNSSVPRTRSFFVSCPSRAD